MIFDKSFQIQLNLKFHLILYTYQKLIICFEVIGNVLEMFKTSLVSTYDWQTNSFILFHKMENFNNIFVNRITKALV